MEMFEVDLRCRITGNSVMCILSTESSNKAWEVADEWNRNNLPDYEIEKLYDSYVDGKTKGLVADVYAIDSPSVLHGVGLF